MLKFTKKHKLFSLFTPLEDRTPSNLSERSNETVVQKKKKEKKKLKRIQYREQKNASLTTEFPHPLQSGNQHRQESIVVQVGYSRLERTARALHTRESYYSRQEYEGGLGEGKGGGGGRGEAGCMESERDTHKRLSLANAAR